MSAPESAAVTPGQAALPLLPEKWAPWNAQAKQDYAEFSAWWQAKGYRDGESLDFSDARDAFASGMRAARQPQPAQGEPGQAAHAAACAHVGMSAEEAAAAWPRRHPGDHAYFAAIEQGVIAARQPQPAPGDELAQVLSSPAELAIWVEANHGDHPEWVDELRALLPVTEQPAPELAAAMPCEALAADNARLREQLAKVLGWFTEEPVVSSRRYASVTRAQLANAYKDGALTVPEELRRFL